jgi:hypothetical protein
MPLPEYIESIANKNLSCEVCGKVIKVGDKYYKTFRNITSRRATADKVFTKREYAVCIKCK